MSIGRYFLINFIANSSIFVPSSQGPLEPILTTLEGLQNQLVYKLPPISPSVFELSPPNHFYLYKKSQGMVTTQDFWRYFIQWRFHFPEKVLSTKSGKCSSWGNIKSCKSRSQSIGRYICITSVNNRSNNACISRRSSNTLFLKDFN